MKSVIDVSNLNGMGYRSLAQYQQADGLYVQAIPRPRPNGIVAQQLYAGRDDGKALGVYSWLWHDPTWRLAPDLRTDQQIRLGTVPNDVQLVMRPMIDVEDNQSTGWQSVSVQQRKDDLMICLDVLHAFSAARNLPDPGIYWSDYYINLLFDGWMPDGVFQWKAHYGIQAGSVIGGLVIGHQFSSTPIDQSVFVDSELQTPVAPGPPVHAGAGVNVDPLNPAGRPSPADLKALGVAWVRLVSRRGVESYVHDCQAAGLKVLAVVAKESGGYVFGGPDIWQIGNEPDASGPASWTMTPDEYVQQWALYRGTYPDLVMVGAGLASGDSGWWRQVAPRLQGCSAVSVHPYGKTADQAKALLDQYRQITPTVLVTEWNRHADEISGYAAMLDQSSAGSWWFCHSDGMVNGFGLVDANGQPKPEYHALRAALTGTPIPGPTPTPPQPTPTPPAPALDLKALADALEQAAAYLRQHAA